MEKKTKAGAAVLISNKIEFKNKAIIRDKEEHHIMIKGTTQQDNITLANIYAINIGAPKYVEQLLMDIKGETNRNIAIVRDFNTPLTSMDKLSKGKINRRQQP